MKWYWAECKDSERWMYAGESREDAMSGFSDGWVAPEEEPNASDEAFYRSVASGLMWNWDSTEEALGEDGHIDFEDLWLDDKEQRILEKRLAAMLPMILPRPEWRTVDFTKQEEIGEEVEEF